MGKRTGLIRADNRCAAESFNGRKLTDKCVFLNHTLNTDRKHDGNNGGQTFGNSGYGKRYGSHKDLKHGNTVYKTYDKDNSAGGKGYDSEIFTKLGKLLLQGCLTFLFVIQHICNFTHFGIHTGSGNNSSRRTVSNRTTGIDHIMTVTNRCAILHICKIILFGRYRFTRKCRFLGFKTCTVQKSCIGRNEIAGFQTDNITGNEFGGINDLFLTVTNNSCVRCRHIFKGVQSLFCFALLIYAHNGIENDNKYDQCRFKKLAPILFDTDHHKGNDGGGNQNENHRILKLIKETLYSRFLFLLAELVFSVFAFSYKCFGRAETAVTVGLQFV